MATEKPYTKEQWRTVRGGWWLHAVLILLIGWLYLIYPMITFTRWQSAGPDSRAKRLGWSLLMSVLLLIPFAWIGVVPWSRRWYFLYTMKHSPAVSASGGADLGRITPPLPSATPAGKWAPDPTTRHELRFWTGSEWTEHVTDGGVPGIDPPVMILPTSPET